VNATQEAWYRALQEAPADLTIAQKQDIATQIPLPPALLIDRDYRRLARLAEERKAGIWEWETLPVMHPELASGKLRGALQRQAILQGMMDTARDALFGISEALALDILMHTPGRTRPNRFQVGGTEVFLAQRRVSLEFPVLSNTLGASEHVILAGLGGSYLPCAWRIKRGPAHPLVEALGSMEVWHCCRDDGRPEVVKAMGQNAIRLYGSRFVANARASARAPKVVAATGVDILRLCSLAETIKLPDGRIFQTRDIEDEPSDPPSVIIAALIANFGTRAEESVAEKRPETHPALT
jgi:hypothetical protein